MKFKVQYYKDSTGQWRWRAVANNGEILAMSSESYVKKHDMMKAIAILWPGVQPVNKLNND